MGTQPRPRAPHRRPTCPICTGLRDTGLSQRPEALPLLPMNQQKGSSCDPVTPELHNEELQAEVFSGTFAGGWTRFSPSPAQWWACSDLDDWPRAPTRLDNRNIHQVISLRLNLFVFYTTTLFSIRRSLRWGLRLPTSMVFTRRHQEVPMCACSRSKT